MTPLDAPRLQENLDNKKTIITNNMCAKLSEIHKIIFCGKALLEREEIFHQTNESNPCQNEWDKLRLSIIISQSMPFIEFVAAKLPLPYLELIEQTTVQNLITRLTSILDDHLEAEIDARGLTLPKNPKLYHRIETIKAAGLISNDKQLHNLRELRNVISHLATPPSIDWHQVENAANEVENALSELAVIKPSPKFIVKKIEMTEAKNYHITGEIHRRNLIVYVEADEKPYCEYHWPYVYFEDPNWKPET